MTRRPIIAGNWKLNKLTEDAVSLIEDIKVKLMDCSKTSLPVVVVCPVFTSLSAVNEVLKQEKGIALGAQNCYWEESGAYTGEISVSMLADLGVSYIIVGHSERRQFFSETDEMINKKAKTVLAKGLLPIICCGETLEQREAGITDEFVTGQIRAALDGLSEEDIAKSAIAYEPIWAIGTGKTCDSSEANRIIKMIRNVVAEVSSQSAADQVRILYGGSVKPSSIEEQMGMSDIDGALVGGASLEAESFSQIVKGTMLARTK